MLTVQVVNGQIPLVLRAYISQPNQLFVSHVMIPSTETRIKHTSGRGRVGVRVGMLPLLKQLLRLPEQGALLSRVADVSVGLEQGPDVEGLPPPEVSVHGPVQGELQGAPVEGPIGELLVPVLGKGMKGKCSEWLTG